MIKEGLKPGGEDSDREEDFRSKLKKALRVNRSPWRQRLMIDKAITEREARFREQFTNFKGLVRKLVDTLVDETAADPDSPNVSVDQSNRAEFIRAYIFDAMEEIEKVRTEALRQLDVLEGMDKRDLIGRDVRIAQPVEHHDMTASERRGVGGVTLPSPIQFHRARQYLRLTLGEGSDVVFENYKRLLKSQIPR